MKFCFQDSKINNSPSKYTDQIKRTLEVNNYQLAVILKFNRQEQWTVQDLQNECNIPTNTMKSVLKSLAFGQGPTQFLAKLSPGEEILPTDSFKVIENRSKCRRVKIPMPQTKEEEKRETKQSLETFKGWNRDTLKTSVILVMKSKNTLEQYILITEVVTELKDKGTTVMSLLDEVIERLIEVDFRLHLNFTV